VEVFGEIMILEETAEYSKIGKSTLYKMAREGKIPAVKIANQRRFLPAKKSKPSLFLFNS